MPRRSQVRLVAFAVAVLVGAGLVWLFLGSELDVVRDLVATSGAWGPMLYVVLHVGLTLVPVSKNLLALVAGALFGIAGGIVLSWVGSMVSAAVGFALARRVGRAGVAELTGPRLQRVDALLGEEGYHAVVMARLTPVLSFTVLNYGAGVSATAWRPYLVGSAVGLLPGTVGYATLGATAGQDLRVFVAAGVFAAALFLVSLLAARRGIRRRRGA